MFDRLKKLLGRASSPASFSDEDYDRWYELKRRGLERVLGPMYEMVSHGVMPFFVGGRLDIYFFPGPSGGTALVSMELIEPHGSGPKRSKIGTYELIAFTKHWIGDEAARQAFDVMLPRLSVILTSVAHYAMRTRLNPGETAEVPVGKEDERRCVIFDEYKKPGVDFMIGDRKHGLLTVIEVFRSEMEYAMEHGSRVVLDRLKDLGHYPYSDLDREPVF